MVRGKATNAWSQGHETDNGVRSARIRREAEGYLELGMPQHALQALGRLGNPAGFGVEALYLWGEGLRAMRRYFEALLPLERAARLAPEDIRVRLALGWCYKRTGRLDLAIDSLEKALRSGPARRCSTTTWPVT